MANPMALLFPGMTRLSSFEEKHGFNKTTPPSSSPTPQELGHWIRHRISSPSCPLVYLPVAGDRFIPWLMRSCMSLLSPTALVDFLQIDPCRFVFQMAMVVIYPTIIQPLFNKLSPIPMATCAVALSFSKEIEVPS